jgi:hypothetical protein
VLCCLRGQTASSVLYIPRLNDAAASLVPALPIVPLRKASTAAGATARVDLAVTSLRAPRGRRLHGQRGGAGDLAHAKTSFPLGKGPVRTTALFATLSLTNALRASAPRLGTRRTKSPSVDGTLAPHFFRLALPPFDAAILALTAATHLDGPDNGRPVVDAATFATRAVTYERLVDLDRVLSANGVAVVDCMLW